MIRTGAFVGLILVFPCPWYMIAVGGLLPLPVILLYGSAGGIVLVFSLVHVVAYTWIFHRVARWAGGVVRTGRVRKPVAAVLLLAALLALSVLPIYGAGENLAGGYVLKHNAYEVYRDVFIGILGTGRRLSTRPTLGLQSAR
jgi:hypothetical protein